MQRSIYPILLSIALLGFGNANAASITYQTRLINAGVNKSDYRASWNAQSSSTSTHAITNFDNMLGGNNTFSHLAVNFSSGNTSILFQIAPDAGYGGALYLDGLKLTDKQYDLWWGNNWGNSSQILSAFVSNLGTGNHVLEAFWAEGCCNGSGSGRFSLNGGATWQNLSTPNLEQLAPVPVPAAVWLFGSGVIGLIGMRRKSLPSLSFAA
ncbi:MAG: CCXG family PEP-CTERM protein [Methylococcaceae bacterium]|nr:CCXG family PEP-CTERM protein [Methylococcaceae bacterium]